jgi:catechol 2,3-dioxygenase-like lactoylglutathione lyase family enzyme
MLAFVAVAVAVIGAFGLLRAQGQPPSAAALPQPTFHHIHLNTVDPEKSIAWYSQYWPKGKKAMLAGFPAFTDNEGFYLLYTKVAKQAPGAFSRSGERSVPQSAFWTFGSTFQGPNLDPVLDRLKKTDAKAFELLTLYGGAEGKLTATHSLGLPSGGQLLRDSALKERQAQQGQQARQQPPPSSGAGLDFAYVVDPDGMLVEVTSGNREGFREHTHFWSERPLCASNWHVEHLGATFPPNANPFDEGLTFKNGKWDPCDVPVGEVTFPTYMKRGQLRIPAGNARVANASWLWYPRQCRSGRCGAGNDQPLSRSRGQVVDHIGLTYPDLDKVIAHLRATNVPIAQGPYKFGDTRALLVDDPDGLAFELIEAK